MEQMEQMEQRHGNTGNGAGKKKKSRRWAFTLNNYTELELEQMEHVFPKYIIGKEVGKKGTPHLQGYGEFKNPQTMNCIVKTVNRVHCEFARGTRIDNLRYCSKEGNYISTWTVPLPLQVLRTDQLYDWQREIVTLVESVPDNRTIHWFWERTGNIGKTALIKYLLVNYDYVTFSRATKSADILTCASEEKTCYLFDFSRSQEGFCPWNALEQLKDGLVTDSKLKKESRNLIINSPHIIIFANWPPEERHLSKDRWNITEL